MTSIENNINAPAKEQIALRMVHHESELSATPKQVWLNELIVLIGFLYTFVIIYLPVYWNWLIYPVLLFSWIPRYVINRWRRRKLTPVENDDIDDDGDEEAYDAARLRASGRPEDLDPISQLQDVPFEPVIIKKAHSTFFYVLLIALILPMTCLFPGRNTSMQIYGYIVALMIIWLLPKIIQWLYPEYYRVVPGRLDVLRSTPLSDRVQIREQWDLRTSTVAADFKDRTLVITEPDGDMLELELPEIYEPYRLVNAVFHAAICTRPAPPLPEDQLLG